MSKRMKLNILAAMMVLVGGFSYANTPKPTVMPMASCHSGSASCSCDAGQACWYGGGACECM